MRRYYTGHTHSTLPIVLSSSMISRYYIQHYASDIVIGNTSETLIPKWSMSNECLDA